MRTPSDNLIGESSVFSAVLEQISQLAPIDKPVLIIGERGTGKELIAARLHYLSTRWDQPFIKLNCSAINENLLESELFGHESGSFTGANKKHLGRFELADKGTLFLDELANSSQSVQEKLLRIIEYGEFERVGGNKTIEVDVRIVAATNENLPQRALQGTFRADLLDRLAFDVVTIPPLRARPGDIMILARHFALEMTRELKREFFAGFTAEAEHLLTAYPWPGNVRELKNVIERNIYKNQPEQPVPEIQFDPFESPYRLGNAIIETALSTEKAHSIETASQEVAEYQPPATTGSFIQFPLDLKQTMADMEVKLIKQCLENSQFNQKKCAELLGLTYHQLRGYLKKYQLLTEK
jgi:psp operon transcriptional activator